MLAAVILMMSVAAKAQNAVGQISFAPTIGFNYASVTDDGAKSMMTFAVGANFEYGVSDNFGMTAGLIYSMQGAKVKGSDIKMKLNYLNVPVLANYYISKGFALKAGIQPGLLLAAKVETDGYSVDVKDECTGVDFSIPVGLSYEINNVVIDARYNIGLNGWGDFDDSGKNSVFMFTVGYKFNL